MTDARALLGSIEGELIQTLTGQPNRVLRIEGDVVIVGTRKSPDGRPVPIAWVQNAIDRLERDGEIEIGVASVGYRSAFVGAVLSRMEGAETEVRPRRVKLPR